MGVSNGSERTSTPLPNDGDAERQLSIVLPPELVELVAERAAAILAETRPKRPEGWLGVKEAAGDPNSTRGSSAAARRAHERMSAAVGSD